MRYSCTVDPDSSTGNGDVVKTLVFGVVPVNSRTVGPLPPPPTASEDERAERAEFGLLLPLGFGRALYTTNDDGTADDTDDDVTTP